MTRSLCSRLNVAAWGLALALGASPCALAAEAMAAGFYEVTTETVMPNLEENLRYATTTERVCLRHQSLSAAFPVLSHEALKGCRLGNESRGGDEVAYRLLCNGRHGTTGGAKWQVGAYRIRGTLEVKLGGKNMTFYQRITAKALGACASGTG